LCWQTYYFWDGFFCLAQCTKPQWIWKSVYLLDKFERHKIKNESLFVQHYDHHVFAQFYVHDELVGIKSNLCPVFFLVIIPNHYLVPLVFVNQNNNISFVHHFHQGNILFEVLDFFLQPGAPGIVLQNFKTDLCGDGEVFLALVWADGVDHWDWRLLDLSSLCRILILHCLLMRCFILVH